MNDKPVTYHMAQMVRVLVWLAVAIFVFLLIIEPPKSDRILFWVWIDAKILLGIGGLLLLQNLLHRYVVKFGSLTGIVDPQTGMEGLNQTSGRRSAFEFELSENLISMMHSCEILRNLYSTIWVGAMILTIRGLYYLRLGFSEKLAIFFGLALIISGTGLFLWRNSKQAGLKQLESDSTSLFLQEMTRASQLHRESGQGQVIVSTTPDGNDSFY